jgi:hypothetical protein
MKGERKLRLVTGGGGRPPAPALPRDEEDLSFTDEERAAAAALREALEGGPDAGEPLVAELRAAYAPDPLDLADLDALVERALGDDDAATSLERASAERLRAELAGEAAASQESELFTALRMAAHPTDLTAAQHAALVEVALRAPLRRQAPRRIAPVTMVALASAAALAAGVALFVGRVGPEGRAPLGATAALVPARSADDLFDAAVPFPRRGQESARIDRIASARGADLRSNRFAAWRVK